MIRISFKHDEHGRLTGFCCRGHAGFARRGRDIVCAAVTALVINTVNSIEAFTDDAFTLDSNEKEGLIRLELTETPSDKIQLLLSSLELGLKGIEQENTKFISFIDWEGKSC